MAYSSLHRRTPIPRPTKPLARGKGLSKARKPLKARRDLRLIAWSKAVRARDGYTCQRCGREAVHARHIAPRGRRHDLKYELSNGIAVCLACHDWIHAHPKQATEQGFLSDEAYEKRAAA